VNVTEDNIGVIGRHGQVSESTLFTSADTNVSPKIDRDIGRHKCVTESPQGQKRWTMKDRSADMTEGRNWYIFPWCFC
jgi:hypothetical protein